MQKTCHPENPRLGCYVSLCWRTLDWRLGLPLAGSQHEAAAEEIKARAAKHLALQQLDRIDKQHQ